MSQALDRAGRPHQGINPSPSPGPEATYLPLALDHKRLEKYGAKYLRRFEQMLKNELDAVEEELEDSKKDLQEDRKQADSMEWEQESEWRIVQWTHTFKNAVLNLVSYVQFWQSMAGQLEEEARDALENKAKYAKRSEQVQALSKHLEVIATLRPELRSAISYCNSWLTGLKRRYEALESVLGETARVLERLRTLYGGKAKT